MGIYVNPGNSEFALDVNDFIYIDKTELIAHTNNRLGRASRYLCVSRPRRFGKTMAANMLTAYYSRGCDSEKLFADKKIARHSSYEQHRNRHNVIRIDVQQFLKSRQNRDTLLDRIQSAVLRELKREFPQCPDLEEEADLQMALNEVYLGTGEGFLFIIDEWDCVFRIAQDDLTLQKDYLDFLRSIFKGAVYTELVYMTGILPIKKYGEHSAINMFEEYSVVDPDELKEFFGFTEEEVRGECSRYHIDFSEMERWYDGYLLDNIHIYNPNSVTNVLRKQQFRSFWAGTETYDALKIYIERNFDGLQEAIVEMLGGGTCPVDTTSFQNDMTTFRSRDDVLTLLVHLGYLTYDKTSRCVLIPNLEVKEEFLRAIKNGTGWDGLMRSLNRSAKLLQDTWDMNQEAVAAGIEEIHSETASLLKYNNETALTCVLYIAYYSASAYYAKPVLEFPTGKGFADIVYLPQKNTNKPALVVELKWNKSAEGAIQQIHDRQYTQGIADYTGEILLIGINYDTKTKRHDCVIEKYIKQG